MRKNFNASKYNERMDLIFNKAITAKKKIEKEEQEIREILYKEFKDHILLIGNEILEDNITVRDFWERLKILCL